MCSADELGLRGTHPAKCLRPPLPSKGAQGQARVPTLTKWPAPALAPGPTAKSWRIWVLRSCRRFPGPCPPPPLRTTPLALQLAHGVLVRGRRPAPHVPWRRRRHCARHAGSARHALGAMPCPRAAGPGGWAAVCICIWIPMFVLLILINAQVVRSARARSGPLSGLGWAPGLGKGACQGWGPGHRSAGALPTRGHDTHCLSQRLTRPHHPHSPASPSQRQILQMLSVFSGREGASGCVQGRRPPPPLLLKPEQRPRPTPEGRPPGCSPAETARGRGGLPAAPTRIQGEPQTSSSWGLATAWVNGGSWKGLQPTLKSRPAFTHANH